jgi:hypothetical protein
MDKQWMAAAGYLSIFLMPALFLAGAITQEPWLAFGAVILVFPLARLVFGGLPAAGAPEWREQIATFLHYLPLVFACVLPVCVLIGLALTGQAQRTDGSATIGLGLSLWMTLLFGTCVAHELIHRRAKWHALLGSMLAGFCGYPALGFEHLAHHARPGDTHLAEYPLRDESVWKFAGRRTKRVGISDSDTHSGRTARDRADMARLHRHRRLVGHVPVPCCDRRRDVRRSADHLHSALGPWRRQHPRPHCLRPWLGRRLSVSGLGDVEREPARPTPSRQPHTLLSD